MKTKNKYLHYFIISIFILLYLIVSFVSTIHSIDFFQLTNPYWLSIILAIAFEVGSMASLASLIILHKISKNLVWGLFILLTSMQMMANTYYAYKFASDFETWSELFNLEESSIHQKRILALISGSILPLIALGFIKSLIEYIKPNNIQNNIQNSTQNSIQNNTPNSINLNTNNISSNNYSNFINDPIIHNTILKK